MPCDLWTCSSCGPSKVHKLARLAAAAEPERFVTLSRVAEDLRTSYDRLRTLSQALRRSGVRWEYLGVPERHRNGFWHFHLLQRGDYIPQRKLSERAESAGMGRVVHVRRIQGDQQAVSYLVKYMSKQEPDSERKHTKRYVTSRQFWPGGRAATELKAFGPRSGEWSAQDTSSYSCS